jgi:hypothetical protein
MSLEYAQTYITDDHYSLLAGIDMDGAPLIVKVFIMTNLLVGQEVDMANYKKQFIMDLEHLNASNAQGCSACGRKFCLGDPVVVACGAWEGGPRVIHENEAVFDRVSGTFIERRCYAARSGASRQ